MQHAVPRREFLSRAATGLMATPLLWTHPVGSARGQDQPKLTWHDVRDWGVEGKGWQETARYFDRLPAKAESVVRAPVWNLSRHSAGMVAHFRTDAREIWIHHKVTSPSLAMPHMPATGVSGVDLYARDDAGQLRWLAVSRPSAQEMQTRLIADLIPGERDFAVYLPLYNGTEFLKIGVPDGGRFTPIPPRVEKPLLFYGTSITHGACASRPGMPHPAILGRRLNRPVINLGFSGNGKMEPEVGVLLAELDPAVYVLDCLPNMVEKEVAERAEPLVRQLREAHPRTPILLVEDRTYANTPFLKSHQMRHAGSRAALRQAFQNLKSAGVEGVHYLAGEALLGEDRDDTTDGSHPSDLGFMRHADAFQPILEPLIAQETR